MLTEKFTTCDDLTARLNTATNDMLRVNKYISFMLIYSSYFDDDTTTLLRTYHANQSDELREQLVHITCAAYVRYLQHHNPGIIIESPVSEQIIESLEELYQNNAEQAYPVYIYPYPRAKFQAQFFGDIFPANTRTYLSVLSDRGYLYFKKSYTLYIQKELEDDMVPLLFNDPTSVVSSLDLGQIISDLESNVTFYKQHYIDMQVENQQLRKTIDQLSTEISSQSLTRWY